MSDYEMYQFMNGMNNSSNGGYYNATTVDVNGAGIWIVVASIIAIIGGILTYFLFVRTKNEPKGKFLKWLKDFLSFKIMWLEPILKVFYYVATIFIVLFSFSFLSQGGAGVLLFFMCLILGPIFVRLAYEMAMMFIMIWRNTRDIAENTANKKK